MNVDSETEVNCILPQADILVPDSSPELLGAVGLPQYTLYVQKGWHLERGAMAKWGLDETLSKGPLHVLYMAMGIDVKRCYI